MRDLCCHCGRRRGNRHCPALDGPICSRCCGENRLIKIACPPTCQHLEQNESFQRKKQHPRYREAFVEVNADLRERKEDLRLLLIVEEAIFQATERIDSLTDADVSVALADLHDHFSPLELIAHPPSLLGRFLLETMNQELTGDIVSHERVRESIARLGRVAEMLRDPKAPRAFLQGLSSHMEGFAPARGEEAQSGLIITPDDLLRP